MVSSREDFPLKIFKKQKCFLWIAFLKKKFVSQKKKKKKIDVTCFLIF